jgi:hypothetical protein
LLFGYAALLVAESSGWLRSVNLFLVLLCVITGIGFIVNGVILAYILRAFRDPRRPRVDRSLLLFLAFMATGLALVFVAAGLSVSKISPGAFESLFRVAGVMFSAALLSEVTGIVLAVVRVLQVRPHSEGR